MRLECPANLEHRRGGATRGLNPLPERTSRVSSHIPIEVLYKRLLE